MKTLLKYASNTYSQNGEDGVVEEICKRLNLTQGWCVEFGAWDGKHLSNTYNLVQKGWKAVYIEGDSAKYADLLLTAKTHPEQIVPIKSFVQPAGENSLDNLLGKTPLPRDFELLSIDIDSYDWWIWKSLSQYQPKIVIIEINGRFSPGQRHVQPVEPPTEKKNPNGGATFTSTKELGIDKGYSLVSFTGNMIFVRNDLVPLLKLPREEINSDELFLNKWLPKSFFQRILSRVNRFMTSAQDA